MNDYFDSDRRIFLKLYKKNKEGIKYWETWNSTENEATVHWGNLGTTGDENIISLKTHKQLKSEINKLVNQILSQDFKEIPAEEQFTLKITFTLESLENIEELEEDLRYMITGHLGWTGNGRCDDNLIGNGELTFFADVIDPQIAIKSLTKEFELNGVDIPYHLKIMAQ